MYLRSVLVGISIIIGKDLNQIKGILVMPLMSTP